MRRLSTVDSFYRFYKGRQVTRCVMAAPTRARVLARPRHARDSTRQRHDTAETRHGGDTTRRRGKPQADLPAEPSQRNVLVHPKQVVRIVALFDLCQPVIVRPVGAADTINLVLRHEVDYMFWKKRNFAMELKSFQLG